MTFRSVFTVLVLVVLGSSLSACLWWKALEPASVHISSEEAVQGHRGETEGAEEGDIVLTSPAANALLQAPFTIEGKAKGTWYFEGDFPIRLLDDQGTELAVIPAHALEDWMQPGYVPFSATIDSFNPGSASTGILVLEKDNPSGLPEHDDKVEIPVRFQEGEASEVQVFFPNTDVDPAMMDCEQVYAVPRVVTKTPALAGAALAELLQGPTASEKSEGFSTSLPEGLEVRRLVIERGVARVDFKDQLEFQLGGSCRILSIRSQIRETLLQFPTVTDVVISIDGRTEDILQP